MSHEILDSCADLLFVIRSPFGDTRFVRRLFDACVVSYIRTDGMCHTIVLWRYSIRASTYWFMRCLCHTSAPTAKPLNNTYGIKSPSPSVRILYRICFVVVLVWIICVLRKRHCRQLFGRKIIWNLLRLSFLFGLCSFLLCILLEHATLNCIML